MERPDSTALFIYLYTALDKQGWRWGQQLTQISNYGLSMYRILTVYFLSNEETKVSSCFYLLLAIQLLPITTKSYVMSSSNNFNSAYMLNYLENTGLSGWSIARIGQGHTIHQNQFIYQLLCRCGYTNCNNVLTRIAADFINHSDDESVVSSTSFHRLYRSMFGEISYSAVSTLQDLPFSI